MFKCLDCGHIFEDGEQAKWEEDRGEYWGTRCTETMSGCPMCKNDYIEIKPCKLCGSYEHDTGDEYCNECKAEVSKRLKRIINNEFSEQERELLKELFDGVGVE